jgi:hypothetical protein
MPRRKAATPRERPDLEAVLAELRSLGSEANRAGQARFGINTARALGLSIASLRPLARRIGRDHELAAALWATGVHEARILAAFVDEPAKVTSAQMDAWAAELDSWDLCDQVCGSLFDRTPYVEEKIRLWAEDEREFVRRAGFALAAEYAVHGKSAGRVLPHRPSARRAARRRSEQLRPEGGQLGTPPDRQALAGAARPCPRARREARRLSRQNEAMDRAGRSQGAFRAHKPRGNERVGKARGGGFYPFCFATGSSCM